MPCSALPRGGRVSPPQFPAPPGFFTPFGNPGHVPAFNDVTDNNPCGLPIVSRVGGVDVSAQNLCGPHYAMKYGLAAMPPPSDAATMLLVHADGADGASTFTDVALGHPLTAVAATVTAAQSKFGGSSIALGGGGVVYAADSPDWEFGAGDFTVECFARFTVLAGNPTLIAHWGSGAGMVAWMFRWEAADSSLHFYWSTDGATTANNIARAWTPTVGQWYHLAAVRSSGVLALYVDGVQLGAVQPLATAHFDGGYNLTIGAASISGTFGLTGNLDEIRISKVARWTGPFSPPASPYT